MASGPTEAAVLEALRSVMDPELHKDLVTLQMVKDVQVKGGAVSLLVTLTTPACPLRDTIENDVRAALAKVPGVSAVELKFDASVPEGRRLQDKAPVKGVKNLIAVASGKGGVGKTTVAVNLAIALRNLGATVGLLDADVYGPNVPVMLGTNEQPRALDQNTIIPVDAYGVKMISMGLLNPTDKPLIWRGPMLHSVVQQFLRSVRWEGIDYLIVDLPPGTGDVQLSLIQTVAVSGAVIVTTPSVVALADVRKAVEMFRQVNVEILGVVENMSYFTCPHCQGRIDVFGHGEGKRMAEAFGVPFLGEIEIDPQIRIGGDTGKPVASLGEDAPGGKSLYAMARNVAARLSVVNLAASAPMVQIL
ncbi:MAG TPA: Mrp/NBP35 family ATP-binding protein [Candidatus Polarisedimenticolia bacterium]|nr:Mrp/NBP35 family ATP-binding protein [Candidatus Polarisedimenticolia bacterium]